MVKQAKKRNIRKILASNALLYSLVALSYSPRDALAFAKNVNGNYYIGTIVTMGRAEPPDFPGSLYLIEVKLTNRILPRLITTGLQVANRLGLLGEDDMKTMTDIVNSLTQTEVMRLMRLTTIMNILNTKLPLTSSRVVPEIRVVGDPKAGATDYIKLLSMELPPRTIAKYE